MACKACRKRKVRCNGQTFSSATCTQCAKHNLTCIYEDPNIHASRLGVARGTIIANYRSSSAVSSSPSALSPPLNVDGSPSPPSALDGPPRAVQQGQPRFNDSFFHDLIPRYMAFVYPVCPVMTAEEVLQHVRQRHEKAESAVVAYAWAGVIVYQMHAGESGYNYRGVDEEMNELVGLALEYHSTIAVGKFSFDRLIGCLFLEWCMILSGKIDCGFYYLRQASSLVQVMLLNADDGDADVDRERLHVVYWLCFIHERTLALMYKYPVCLDSLDSFPSLDSGPLQCGFHYLLRTYLLVDREFLSAWRNDGKVTVSREWIEEKHGEFTDAAWLSDVEQLPAVQQADLITTRLWLCTLLWQTAISNLSLSSETSPTNALSLNMPLHILDQVRALLGRFQPVEVTMHALGLVHKLFEITTTIADVLLCLPPDESDTVTWSQIDGFLLARNFLFDLPTIKPSYRDVLLERTRQIVSKLRPQ